MTHAAILVVHLLFQAIPQVFCEKEIIHQTQDQVIQIWPCAAYSLHQLTRPINIVQYGTTIGG